VVRGQLQPSVFREFQFNDNFLANLADHNLHVLQKVEKIILVTEFDVSKF